MLGSSVLSEPMAIENHGPAIPPAAKAAATQTNTAPSQIQTIADSPRSTSSLGAGRTTPNASAKWATCSDTAPAQRRSARKRELRMPASQDDSSTSPARAAMPSPASHVAVETDRRREDDAAPAGRRIRQAEQAEEEDPQQHEQIQDPLDDDGTEHPQDRGPELAAEPHGAKHVPGAKGQQVVDRDAREERPDAGAEREAGLEGVQHPPPPHDAHRVPAGEEGQGEQERGHGQRGKRAAQRSGVQVAREQPDERRGHREPDRQRQPSGPVSAHSPCRSGSRTIDPVGRENPNRSLTR